MILKTAVVVVGGLCCVLSIAAATFPSTSIQEPKTGSVRLLSTDLDTAFWGGSTPGHCKASNPNTSCRGKNSLCPDIPPHNSCLQNKTCTKCTPTNVDTICDPNTPTGTPCMKELSKQCTGPFLIEIQGGCTEDELLNCSCVDEEIGPNECGTHKTCPAV